MAMQIKRNQLQELLRRQNGLTRCQSVRLQTALAVILLLFAVSVGELSRAQGAGQTPGPTQGSSPSQDQQIQLIMNDSNMMVTQENNRTVMTIDLIQELQRQQPTLFAPGQSRFDIKSVGIEAKTRMGGGQILLLVEGNEGPRYVDLQRVETDPDLYESKDGYQKIELSNSEPEIRKAQLILLNPMRVRGLKVTLGSLRLLQVTGVYGDFVASKWTPVTAPAITPLPQKSGATGAKPEAKSENQPEIKTEPKPETKPVETKPAAIPAVAPPSQVPTPKVVPAPEEPKAGPVGQSAVVRVPPPAPPAAPVAVPRPVNPPPKAPPVVAAPAPVPPVVNHALPSASERPPAPVVAAPRPAKPPVEKRAVTPQVRCLDGICIGMKVYHRRTYWEGRVIGIDIRRHTMVVRFGDADEIFDASVSTRDLERNED